MVNFVVGKTLLMYSLIHAFITDTNSQVPRPRRRAMCDPGPQRTYVVVDGDKAGDSGQSLCREQREGSGHAHRRGERKASREEG